MPTKIAIIKEVPGVEGMWIALYAIGRNVTKVQTHWKPLCQVFKRFNSEFPAD